MKGYQMDILARLNSGELHAKARTARPDCVDSKGNVHRSPERATYATWRIAMENLYGSAPAKWPAEIRRELKRRHVA
jgi:hypothetical protein